MPLPVFDNSAQNSNDSKENEKSPPLTADDYIRLLSKKYNINSGKPPPVPPKPKTAGTEFSTTDVSETSFRKYSQTTLHHATRVEPNPISKRDFDTNNDFSSGDYYTREGYNRTSSVYIGGAKPRTQIGCLIYDSNADSQMTSIGSEARSASSCSTRPIVTESPEEANNNILSANRSSNTSTVEFQEVSDLRGSQRNNYGNTILTTTSTENASRNSTFIRSKKQQQRSLYEGGMHADPIVTAPDSYEECRTTTPLAEIEADPILNESPSDQPPRTSTPNRAQSCVYGSSSSSGTSTATNDNIKQIGKQSPIATRDNDSFQTDEDTVNISRDTDDLANTSGLNQSGGCELVGVNDGSDPSGNSKELADEFPGTDPRGQPYIVQTFDETTMSVSPNIPAKVDNFDTNHTDKNCVNKIQDLEKLSNNLLSEIEGLKFQVTALTSKVDELETRLGEKGAKQTNFTQSNHSEQFPSLSSQYDSLIKNAFSKSTSTLNRANNQRGSTPTSNSTHGATASRIAAARNSSALLSKSLSQSSNRLTPQYSNNTSKTLRKSNVNASTSSLYGEGSKHGNISVSPTQQVYRQQHSPTSTLSYRRDPNTYTSMVSLNSLTPNSNASTLKRSAAISDSISNISQIGSMLSSWPSESNFLLSKNQDKEILFDENERTIRVVLYNTLITIRVPTWMPQDYHPEKIPDTPLVRIKLDWVHGYRGRDCRSNLYYLPTGECIYFVGSIVVLYNPTEKTQRHYLGHTDSVKCLAVHPNKLIVASGQSSVLNRKDKRPIVRVWNTVSLATLRIIGFNEDFDCSICCLAFSKHDQGATLAVVDESTEHTITLLDWQREKSWRIAEANSGHDPVLAIDFHPLDKYSLVAIGRSTVNFWDIRGLTLAKKAGLFDKYDRPKYVLCLTFNDLGDTITGDSNGNVIIWPRGSNRPKRVIYDTHQGGVFSVLAMKDGSYLTGGRDRRVVEWDEEFNATGRATELPEHCGGVRYITYARGDQVLIGTIRNSILLGTIEAGFTLIMNGHTDATTSMAVHPSLPQYLTGGFDEQVHMFDAKTHSVLWTKCIMTPATAACFSPNGLQLVIGSTSGKWLVFDSITQEILFTACDGSGTISCVKFSPDGEYFCMGSSDSQAYLYQVGESGSKFMRVGTCVGHSSPIKEIDWSDDSRYIQTQSMNFELLYWKAANCRPLEDPEVIGDIKWFTQNCSIGFNALGLWSDQSLVNCCDKSNNSELMASANDLGNINVFKWPPCYNQCHYQKNYGNVDKFNFIRFLRDDSKLIAVGAKSCVTTEWIIEELAA